MINVTANLLNAGFLAVSISNIMVTGAVVGIIGLIIGILLGIAAKVFHVEVDERELFVRDLLPGNNCGGCGYAGCDALAKAINEGIAPVSACPVANSEIHAKIGEVMGKAVEASERNVAFVQCNGTCDKTKIKYNYHGVTSCKKAAMVPGRGPKVCSYGCMGYGDCVSACEFDAIHIVNGVAFVDKEKCVACGKCVIECPNLLIELVPISADYKVMCSSKDKGKDVMAGCSVGCIACMKCTKVCEVGAITVTNNLAHIDYTKCTRCGKCAEVCPRKIIL